MSRYQYRITVNASFPRVLDSYPSEWGAIAEAVEARGGVAYLERRALFNEPAEGTVRLGGFYVSGWEYFARVEA